LQINKFPVTQSSQKTKECDNMSNSFHKIITSKPQSHKEKNEKVKLLLFFIYEHTYTKRLNGKYYFHYISYSWLNNENISFASMCKRSMVLELLPDSVMEEKERIRNKVWKLDKKQWVSLSLNVMIEYGEFPKSKNIYFV
jgi:hypothetical protein